MRVNLNQVEETSVHTFTVEASELQLRPGQPVPRIIETDIGNGQPFVGTRVDRNDDGDIQAWRYAQSCGCCTLVIFND